MLSSVARHVFLVVVFVSASHAYAAATFEAVTGDVRAGASGAAQAAVAVNQRIETGAVVTTGPRSRTTLRFDDGQAVALHENTEFRVSDYAFAKEDPAKDRSAFELVRGALRSVTGSSGSAAGRP